MLLTHIDPNARHTFAADRRNGFHLLFVTTDMLKQSYFEPHWVREAGDERSFAALLRWTSVRRDQWQAWGRLAEAIGREAFYQHMRDLMTAEPIAECTGTVVQRQDDIREIVLGEMLAGTDGVVIEELYRHRFASAAARDRFYDWFYTDRNCDSVAALLQIGYNQGTAALGRALDALADDGAAQPGGKKSRKPHVRV